MKRCPALFLVLVYIFCLFPCYATEYGDVTVSLQELEWTWEPLNIATFEGNVSFTGQAPENVILKLSLSVLPDESDPGEVVFQTVNEKKLTLRKQKPVYLFSPEGNDSCHFIGSWKTPEEVFFTRIDISCRIYNEDESILLAESHLVFSRSSSDIAKINDGKIRLNYDFSTWTLYTAAAAAVIWILALIRIRLNKKRKKES